MRSDLKGQSILVTRPAPEGAVLCAKILASGGKAVYFPTIEIVPLPFQIENLNQLDWMIFISPQAVMQSVQSIKKKFPHFPPKNLKIAAIGLGTKLKLQEENIRATICPEENFSTEGLLVLSDFKKITGQKIAIIKGKGGRELLTETLRVRGALVSEVITYERVLPAKNLNPIVPYLKTQSLDAVVVTSVTGVENLEALIDQQYHAYLHTVLLVVVGERIKKRALALGFEKIISAKNASHDAILQALKG